MTNFLIVAHTLVSIFAVLIGAAAIADLTRSRVTSTPIKVFFAAAAATSLSGFFLPLPGVSPAVVVGLVALTVLAAVAIARPRVQTSPVARWVYAGGFVVSHYLLVFVAIAQTFAKVGLLQSLAPTQSEPPFAIVQAATLAAFLGVGLITAVRFRPDRPGGVALSGVAA